MRIEVRSDKGDVITAINRKIFNKGFCGNFVPHFARYKNKVYQVQGGIDYAYMHGTPDEFYITITVKGGTNA